MPASWKRNKNFTSESESQNWSKMKWYHWMITLHSFFSLAGYERDIPGYPTYSVIGDELEGVYNLQIKNISLRDDATFECQVGPALSPVRQSRLRASAKVDVICEYLRVFLFIVLFCYVIVTMNITQRYGSLTWSFSTKGINKIITSWKSTERPLLKMNWRRENWQEWDRFWDT